MTYDTDNERPAWGFPRGCKLYLSCSGDHVRETTVTIDGVEEDIQGADVVTFTCPQCGERHRSRRYG